MSETATTTYTEAALTRRLHGFEREFGMGSDEFLALWEAGELPHLDSYFIWVGLCGRLGVREREFA